MRLEEDKHLALYHYELKLTDKAERLSVRFVVDEIPRVRLCVSCFIDYDGDGDEWWEWLELTDLHDIALQTNDVPPLTHHFNKALLTASSDLLKQMLLDTKGIFYF